MTLLVKPVVLSNMVAWIALRFLEGIDAVAGPEAVEEVLTT